MTPQASSVAMSAEEECMRLAAAGAIMTVQGNPDQHLLVGYFEWIGSNRVFWFNANGSDDHDANVLEFDRVSLATGEIGFVRAGRLAGCLVAIDAARVDDRDDYRIAWQIWQQVAPMQQAKIRSLLARHEIATTA
jgi:hypothetical protein